LQCHYFNDAHKQDSSISNKLFWAWW